MVPEICASCEKEDSVANDENDERDAISIIVGWAKIVSVGIEIRGHCVRLGC